MEFVPLSLETLGGWGPAAQALVKDLVLHAELHTHYSRAEALQLMVQSVALAVQRGNAFLLHSAYQRSVERRELHPR